MTNEQRPERQHALTLDPTRLGLPLGPQSDLNDIRDALLRAQDECIVLAAATLIDHLPVDHVISFQVVLFPIEGIHTYFNRNANAQVASNHQANGVWYSVEGGKLAHLRPALNMLAQACGIGWVHAHCGRTDDRQTPFKWSYRMTCTIKGLDGRTRPITAEHELDLTDGSPASDKALGSKNNAVNLRNARIHGAQICESKAANRAVRAALGLRAYSLVEAAKPFVFPMMRWVPPADDPEIRRMIAAAELGIVDQMYGGGSVRQVDPGSVIEVSSAPPEAPRRAALQDYGEVPDYQQQSDELAQRQGQPREVYDAESSFEGDDGWAPVAPPATW